MCQGTERPQRRHRAVYLAPSVGQWHRQQQQNNQQQQQQVDGAAATGSPQQEQQQQQQLDFSNLQFPSAPDPSLGELGIPLLLEVPYQSPLVVSPPSSAESCSYDFQQQIQQSLLPTNTTIPPRTFKQQVMDAILGMYHGFVDFFLLMIVCFMGCFFYDVEVKVVQADRQRTRARGRSGRVIIRTNEYQNQKQKRHGIMTSLLRTPPRSGNYSRSSRSPNEDTMWDNVV